MALAAFTATVLYGIVQVLQIVNVLRPPLDAMLVYGFSLLIVVPFIMAMLAFQYAAPQRRNSGAAPPSSSRLCTAHT